MDVVEDHDERSFGRGLLEGLADRPGELLCGARRFRLAEQRADRRRGGLVGGQQLELLEHLDDRPVGDALAVGETAAAHDPRLDRREQLGCEPRLADAAVGDDRHQLAALLGQHALPELAAERKLALPSDEPHPVRPLRRFARAHDPVGGDRLGSARELQ